MWEDVYEIVRKHLTSDTTVRDSGLKNPEVNIITL